MAPWAQIPAASLGVVNSVNHNLLDVLESRNEFLASIQDSFLDLVRDLLGSERRIEVAFFCEELPTLGNMLVVPRESATCPGYNVMTVHANHREMAKFASVEETGFKRVVGIIARWKSMFGKPF